MELINNNNNEFDTLLMTRFPRFELSYETVSHKKVSPLYNICFAIPQGKKCYAWFTFYGLNDTCFLLDINRDKKITNTCKIDISFKNKLELGTILYGSIYEDDLNGLKYFIIEDLIYYKGVSLKNYILNDKLYFIKEIIGSINKDNNIHFCLPVLWNIENNDEFECSPVIPTNIQNKIGYNIRHIQYRCLTEIKPYLNVFVNKKITFTNITSQEEKNIKKHCFDTIDFKNDYTKPQFRNPTVFQIVADIQFEVYHLFCYGLNNRLIYYGVAGIPSYKTSVFMNSLFRKIKENNNLDFIEESDDEEDFENIDIDKYVNVEKTVLMECIFNMKFKKWFPVKVVNDKNKIVNINNLQMNKNYNYTNNNYNKNYTNTYNNYNKNTNNNFSKKDNYYAKKNIL